jgi:hypothetical protein
MYLKVNNCVPSEILFPLFGKISKPPNVKTESKAVYLPCLHDKVVFL